MSKRFIQSTRGYLQHGTSSLEYIYRRSSVNCNDATDLSQLQLLPRCGHIACIGCFASRTNDEDCVHSGCTGQANDGNMILMVNLGAGEGQSIGNSFVKKFATIIQLVKKIQVLNKSWFSDPTKKPSASWKLCLSTTTFPTIPPVVANDLRQQTSWKNSRRKRTQDSSYLPRRCPAHDWRRHSRAPV